MGVEEERKLAGELVDVQACSQRRFDIGNAVRQCKRHFLHGGRARFPDVIARDRDRIPVRYILGAEREDVCDQAHRWRGREDIRAAGDIFLEDIVLDRAAQLLHVDALASGHGDVHGKQDACRRVDGHRRGDLIQRDLVEELLHVADGRDGHAHLADLSHGDRVVGVVADLGRQVKGNAQAGLPVLEQVAVAAVEVLGGGKAGILAHRPEARAVHGRLHAARIRVLAREVELVLVIGIRLRRKGDPGHFDPGAGLEALFALLEPVQGFLEGIFLPFLVLIVDCHFFTTTVHKGARRF